MAPPQLISQLSIYRDEIMCSKYEAPSETKREKEEGGNELLCSLSLHHYPPPPSTRTDEFLPVLTEQNLIFPQRKRSSSAEETPVKRRRGDDDLAWEIWDLLLDDTSDNNSDSGSSDSNQGSTASDSTAGSEDDETTAWVGSIPICVHHATFYKQGDEIYFKFLDSFDEMQFDFEVERARASLPIPSK